MDKRKKEYVKWVKNPSYVSDYNKDELSHFTDEKVKDALHFQQTHPSYAKTPLYSLTELADYLNVADIKVKDESFRFGLNAFKVMGGLVGIGKYLADRIGKELSSQTFEQLRSPDVKKKIGEITFISATDGNHGRGIAWSARELGQKSVIYLPKGSSPERLRDIRKEGAYAEITDLNYDDTVRMCERLAGENGWVMIQDTGWEGYDAIPLSIMQGYGGIAREIIDELEYQQGDPPTHIILQVGVGSFAAAIAAYFQQYYLERPPKIILAEADAADCYYRSFANKDGVMSSVTGDLDTIMAGLACGVPNPRAFRILNQYAHASFSCADELAALGMRVLGHPLGDDPKIISGESGAVPLGLLYYLLSNKDDAVTQHMDLDTDSKILIINSEGDTDQQHYRDVVWKGIHPALF